MIHIVPDGYLVLLRCGGRLTVPSAAQGHVFPDLTTARERCEHAIRRAASAGRESGYEVVGLVPAGACKDLLATACSSERERCAAQLSGGRAKILAQMILRKGIEEGVAVETAADDLLAVLASLLRHPDVAVADRCGNG
jgi:hypothetical protein